MSVLFVVNALRQRQRGSSTILLTGSLYNGDLPRGGLGVKVGVTWGVVGSQRVLCKNLVASFPKPVTIMRQSTVIRASLATETRRRG